MSTEPLKAEAYAHVFENLPEGRRVLEDLISRFGGNPYVRGGVDAARETDYRAGRAKVIDFIIGRLNQARGLQDQNAED